MFITLEGIDGSGKTTQIKLLYEYLKQKKGRVVLTREPGGTRVGELVRSLILGEDYAELEPQAELFLLLADRAQHVREVIAPALLAGEIVLCDRFIDSTVAYQGFGRWRGHKFYRTAQRHGHRYVRAGPDDRFRLRAAGGVRTPAQENGR